MRTRPGESAVGELDRLLAALGLADDLEARAWPSPPPARRGGTAPDRRRSARGPGSAMAPLSHPSAPRRQGADTTPPGGSSLRRATVASGRVGRLAVGQVEQDGLHPAVDVGLLGQAELREHRVDVLLHRPLREPERARRPTALFRPWAISARTSLSRGVRNCEGRVGPARAGVDQRLDHLGVDHRPAGRDLADRTRRAGRRRRPAPSGGRRAARTRRRGARARSAGSTYWLSTTTPSSGCVWRSCVGGPHAFVGAGGRHADVGERRRRACSVSTVAMRPSKSSHTPATSMSGSTSSRRVTASRTR